jgi:hypothetical protein
MMSLELCIAGMQLALSAYRLRIFKSGMPAIVDRVGSRMDQY